jgi:hypothetical protein
LLRRESDADSQRAQSIENPHAELESRK